MFLKRNIIEEINVWLKKREILILIGPRQVGKTTILKYFYDKIDGQKYWFNLDKIKDCEIFSDYYKLVNFLELQGFDLSKKLTLFVDEFQYCRNSEIIFKNLYDSFNNIKILASGSSSLNIKNLIQESLAGRKKIFKIYPLNLEEFISWRKGEDFSISIFKGKIYIKGIADEYLKYLYEFMVWGGYPKVALDRQFAQDHLENIFDLYLKKDVLDLLNIRHLDSFKKIVVYLAINNGQQVNYSQIANFVDVDVGTVKNYIEILEETFLIKKVFPFYTNKNKEIIKAPKVYFIDNGVRNFFIKNFIEDLSVRQDAGVLFESVFLQELLKANYENIKYWRTKTKQEVDFILDNITGCDAIELKFKDNLSRKDFSGLLKFKETYLDLVNKLYLVSKYGSNNCLPNIYCENLFSFVANL